MEIFILLVGSTIHDAAKSEFHYIPTCQLPMLLLELQKRSNREVPKCDDQNANTTTEEM
jgi:hypothetical protein